MPKRLTKAESKNPLQNKNEQEYEEKSPYIFALFYSKMRVYQADIQDFSTVKISKFRKPSPKNRDGSK